MQPPILKGLEAVAKRYGAEPTEEAAHSPEHRLDGISPGAFQWEHSAAIDILRLVRSKVNRVLQLITTVGTMFYGVHSSSDHIALTDASANQLDPSRASPVAPLAHRGQ